MNLPDVIDTVIYGDCTQVLSTFPDDCIHTVVTSPPYWGLRDYGVEDQLGLEQTPEEYTENMVKVFSQVLRALRPEGTLWLNLGDSYATGGNGGGGCYMDQRGKAWINGAGHRSKTTGWRSAPEGLKHKDLVGIPWRVAFALQAAGWYLRQDIIWSKPNCMPEAVRDRCTKAHEYIFLMSKKSKYYYDQQSILEFGSEYAKGIRSKGCNEKRNRRSVWHCPTVHTSDSHFATYPQDLIIPCIMAGCPRDGIVLDPFSGSGTTAIVAKRLGRHYVGIDINPEYCAIALKRLASTHYNEELF